MAIVFKISLLGKNVLTEIDPKNFSLFFSTEQTDYFLLKEQIRSSLDIGNGANKTIDLNANYIPTVLVFAEVASGQWALLSGDSSDYGAHFEITFNKLIIYNDSLGATKTFKYFIMYDQQI